MEEQQSPEWFESRKGRITASSVGAIMGLAPYATRADVMRRMVREYHNAPSEFSGNVATEYGTFHEEGAIAEFQMETGYTVTPAPFVKLDDYFGASPDGYIHTLLGDYLIEVKCPYGLRNGGEFKSISDQKHYYAQIQIQLVCTGYDECYFYQWAPHGSMLELVQRDEEFLLKIADVCGKFYADYLIEREFPNAAKYLEDNIKKVFDEKNLTALMEEYQALKRTQKDIEERQKEILAELVALTDEKGGSIAGHTLFKTEKQGAISYSKAVKELMPNADLEPYRGNSSMYWSIK